MPLARTGYQLCFEEICPGNAVFGRASLVPWDSEIFGFPVAVYQAGAARLDAAEREKFMNGFAAWTGANRVSLCSCTVPANESDSLWKYYLGEAGFHFVDFSVRSTLKGLQNARLPEARTALREARTDDHEAIKAMALEAFHNGRYHADPLFPRELADKRYGRWVGNALSAETGIDRVYVMGQPGSVQGFFHVTVEEDISDLRLAAIAPALRGTLLGFDLYVSVLHLLKGLGIRRVVTSISAANTAVMNVYAMLGFSFSSPEMIFHWHRALDRGEQ
jgi:RimJ/RimL family protein N-acetyltransferase